MIELPEAVTLGKQISNTLVGKTITDVFNANSLHQFTFFYGDPLTYKNQLTGKCIQSAEGCGMFVDILLDHDTTISINDGVNMRYGNQSTLIPEKYQLLITLHDNTFLVCTVTMYGGIAVYSVHFDTIYHNKSQQCISPLRHEFNEAYFERLFAQEKKNIPVKALLPTEQRIPGVGNGVIQDILFQAFINPKRKIQSLTDHEKGNLFKSLKSTLLLMTKEGGRDTETDLLGNKGKYKTLLSKNTWKQACPNCGNNITKENFLGGTIYYCSNCQKI